jgi:hypothetical protein
MQIELFSFLSLLTSFVYTSTKEGGGGIDVIIYMDGFLTCLAALAEPAKVLQF